MKRKIQLIIVVLIFCSGIIFLLSKINDKGNGSFNRRFIKQQPKVNRVINLGNRSYYFNLRSKDGIVLKNYQTPFSLYILDTSNFKINKRSLTPPKKFNREIVDVFFDYAFRNAIITNGLGEIGSLFNGQSEYFKIHKLRPDRPILTSNNTFVVRSFTDVKGRRSRELVNVSISDSAIVKNKFHLPTQVDGFFCTDGYLQYDPIQKIFCYVFAYRGEFLSLDTNLSLRYRANTIDTNRKARIMLGAFHKKTADGKTIDYITQVSPPSVVTKYATIFNGKLYLSSGIRGNKETKTQFENSATIDVYQVKNGTYLYSFHIPKYMGQKLKGFQMGSNKIFALFNDQLIIYDFREM